MAYQQFSREDMRDCLMRMSPYQKQRFAAASTEQQQYILQAMLTNSMSPTSTESSPGSYIDDDDESVLMSRTASISRTDTNFTDYSQRSMDDYDEQLMTPVSPTSPSNRHRPQYVCLHHGCGRAFDRHGDLTRHMEGRHNPERERFDCPVPGCNRVGSNGLPRKDKVYDHMRDKHKIPLVKAKKGESRTSKQVYYG